MNVIPRCSGQLFDPSSYFIRLNNLSRKNDGRQVVKVNLGWWILFHTSSSGCNLEVSAHQKGQPRLMQHKLHHAVSFYQIPLSKVAPYHRHSNSKRRRPCRGWQEQPIRLVKDVNLSELRQAKNLLLSPLLKKSYLPRNYQCCESGSVRFWTSQIRILTFGHPRSGNIISCTDSDPSIINQKQ